MRRVYFALSLGIVALGFIHMAATPRHLTSAAVWFASGGFAMVLTGALNLLRQVYGAAAPGLRVVCIAANVAMTAFALVAGYVGRASAGQFVVVLGLMGGATLLSVLPAAQR